MKAFIDIRTKNQKGGAIYVNDQVNDLEECFAWFNLNMQDLKKIAKRRNTESICLYVKEEYEVIYEKTL